MPEMTGGLLDSDNDNSDVPSATIAQGYIGDQSSLIAAITAELTSKGVAIATINQYLPMIENVANGLLAVFAPPLAPLAAAVENVLPKQIPT